ncbi:Crp/Fnr family transcriptional regulator [Rapidithrix thailandica]|uniref:Crp/Fnr family transcriptional regulator n=1 Tax=Rapidithrix thailandica TaxID=413964 RepID=A0AAW9S2Q4_9BACT
MENRAIWYFEDVDLYKLLCPHKLKDFKEEHKFYHLKKNEFVYFQNDPSNCIYMIAKGRVKIGSYSEEGNEIVKAILSEGELFGELALMGEERRMDFAQAMDPETTVCPMNVEQMQELIRNHKTLSFKLFKLMGLRIKKLERRVESLVFKDSRTRIIELLREMALEKGQKIGFEIMIKNHLTHKDIAQLTGTSRQTVTTILNELKEANLIYFDRKKILIRDLEKLT